MVGLACADRMGPHDGTCGKLADGPCARHPAGIVGIRGGQAMGRTTLAVIAGLAAKRMLSAAA
jgi:hypothetical protein